MVFDPASIRKNIGVFFVAVSIAVMALILRIHLMQTVETRLDADESIVGLMAKHIATGQEMPLFFYGQHYGGGHVIEALGASIWWKFRDQPSAAAVQSVPVIASVLLVLLVFYYMKLKFFDNLAAILAATILSISIPFTKSSLKADGYVETILFCFLSLILYEVSEKAFREKANRRLLSLVFMTGLCLGIGVWSYDFAILYIPVIIALSAPRVLRSFPRIVLFVSGLIAGASPAIYDNLTNNFAHLKHLTSGGPTGASSPESILINFISLFKDFLPAFFSPDCIHNFSLPANSYSWLIYLSILISFIILIVHFKKVPLPFFALPVIIVIAISVSGYAGKSPRYLLPLEPFLSMSIAVAASILFSHKKKAASFIAFAILALFFYGTLSGFSYLNSDNSIVEGNMKTNPDSLPAVISFLEKSNINCIYTSYFIKWQVIFLTNEKINAVDVQIHEKKDAYNKYETKGCASPDLPVFVFHRGSPYNRSITEIYNNNNLNFKIYSNFENHIVAVPFLNTEKEQP